MPQAHRRVALIVGAAIATAAVAAIPALATNVVKIDSQVTISHHAPAFHGRVKSDNHACEVGRNVKLFKRRHGPDDFLGHDETNHKGRWKVGVNPLSSGAYYAKVTRREEGTAGTIYVCRRDRSKTVVVD
jgi:hypothetical protein